MQPTLLGLLRCPYCGTRLELAENAALVVSEDRVEYGVLGCECCAFPVVAGIPVLTADDRTRAAIEALESSRHEAALLLLLGLEGEAADRFAHRDSRSTYRQALELLSPDAEGTYFFYRFSDPSFLCAEAVVESVVRAQPVDTAPALDLCGGSGHLTRVVDRLRPATAPPPVLADLHLWKLWLATRFTVPVAQAVCCDANAPLPFATDLFSLVLLADAFPYIWHKRLCADEMVRVARPEAPLLLPHLHSAWGENLSAGDTLSPGAYRDLFAARQPRLFSDARLLDDLIDRRRVDLGGAVGPEALGNEPSLTLVASPCEPVFADHPAAAPRAPTGTLIINPLYRVETGGDETRLTLVFPTPEYEEEFGDCRRYLPDELRIAGRLQGTLRPELFGNRYDELRRRRVLLDAPTRYR